MFNFDTSISSLRASQVALDTIAHNIANANTPGYSRQQVILNERQSFAQDNHWIGWGVDVHSIRRVTDATIESAINRNVTRQNMIGQSLSVMRQIEQRMATGSQTLQNRLETFFDEITRWQNNPADSVSRISFTNKAAALTQEFNQLNSFLNGLKRDVKTEADVGVEQVNAQFAELFKLNRQIKEAVFAGYQPNDLLDRHQQLLNELAQSIDIEATPDGAGFKYRIADLHVTTGETPFQLQSSIDDSGKLVISTKRNDIPLRLSGGKFAALQQSYNEQIPRNLNALDSLARRLIQSFDSIHSTGLPLSGPYQTLYGQRAVSKVDIPLAQATAPFAVQSGDLFISVTDRTSGVRTLERISFDPSTQSLNDLAASLSAIDNIQAIVDTQTGKLVVSAKQGFGVDFAGRLPTAADRTSITGTAAIQFSGQYTGTQNDRYQFSVVGSGTVGVASDLKLRVTDSNGNQLTEVNLGSGYEPNSAIDLPSGVTLRIDTGTLNNGDSFGVDLVQNSDSTGVLVALGLGTFFVGNGAGNMGVDPQVSSNPDRLTASRDGELGDGSNLARMAALRTQALMPEGQSLSQFASSLVTRNAVDIDALTNEQSDLEMQMNQLTTQREGISGVDPNEEVVHLMRFQRAFEASVRVVTVIDQMLSDIMSIIR